MSLPAGVDPAAILREIPLNAPVVEIFFNGIYTCLLIGGIGMLLYKRDPKDSKQRQRTWYWILLISAMYILATIHSAITWNFVITAFSRNGTSPKLLNALLHQKIVPQILADAATAIGYLLADCLMIWRCWMVWDRRYWVIIAPSLATLAGTICAALSMAGQFDVSRTGTVNKESRLAPLLHFSTPFLGLSLAVTLITTSLIAWRVFRVQREVNKIVRGPSPIRSVYSKSVELVVESSALYCASLLIFVIMLAQKSVLQDYMEGIHAQVAGIAPTILIIRVALGHARQDQEWSFTSIPIQFASNELTADPEKGTSPSPGTLSRLRTQNPMGDFSFPGESDSETNSTRTVPVERMDGSPARE